MISKQCSIFPELSGSPWPQLVKFTGLPVDIHTNAPSSPWSVPEVQTWSTFGTERRNWYLKVWNTTNISRSKNINQNIRISMQLIHFYEIEELPFSSQNCRMVLIFCWSDFLWQLPYSNLLRFGNRPLEGTYKHNQTTRLYYQLPVYWHSRGELISEIKKVFQIIRYLYVSFELFFYRDCSYLQCFFKYAIISIFSIPVSMLRRSIPCSLQKCIALK